MLGSTFRTFTALLSEEEEAVFMMRCKAFEKNYKPGSKPPTPPRNFRTHWEFFCRREWQRVLCLFTLGAHSVICFPVPFTFQLPSILQVLKVTQSIHVHIQIQIHRGVAAHEFSEACRSCL